MRTPATILTHLRRPTDRDPAAQEGESSAEGLRGGFFGVVWIGMAVLLVGGGMVADRSSLAVIGLLALATTGIAWGWARLVFRDVVVDAQLSRLRALPGDVVELTMVVRNRKLLPVPWLTIEIEIGSGVTVVNREATPGGLTGRQTVRLTTMLAPFGRLTWRLKLECPNRGLHPVGPIRMRAGDPFGFFTGRREWSGAGQVLTYPQVRTLPPLIPAREIAGDARIVRQLTTDPARIAGVRDYQPSDPLRAIHWKATARSGTLQVRLEEPAASQRLMIAVNLDTFDHYWEGLDGPVAERMIAATASIAMWAEGAGFAVGLAANGLIPGTSKPLSLPPVRGTGQRERCLEALARLGLFSTTPFARIIAAEGQRLEPGAVLVVVTSRMPQELSDALATVVIRRRRVIIVPVNGCPVPRMRGMTTYLLPDEPTAESTQVDAAD